MDVLNVLKGRLKPHLPFIAICAVYLILGAVLAATWSRFQLNPDAGSYFTIAEKYARGDFRHALNGYWGPLLSVLLVPAAWLDLNMIVTAKLISLVAGLGILILVYIFLQIRNAKRIVLLFAISGLAGLVLEWAVIEAVTPDLLLAFFIVLFAMLLANFIKGPTRNHALVLGVLGAVMYFTKGFGFYFFIGAIGCVALWQWLRVDRAFKPVFWRYLPMAVVFVALVLPFIALNTLKYGGLTINNAGAYNKHIYGPIGKSYPPMTYLGPLTPPNGTAFSVWEDPSLVTPLVPGWSPLSSWDNVGFFLNSVIARNLNYGIHGFYRLGPFVAFALGAAVIMALQKRKYVLEARLFLGMSLLMLAGYAAVLIDNRYLWPIIILAIAISALWASALEKKVISNPQLVASAVLMVGVTLVFVGQQVVASKDVNKDWWQASMVVADVLPSGSNIVSDDFASSYATCYYLRVRCYSALSVPQDESSWSSYYQVLKQQDIKYFVDYHLHDENQLMHDFAAAYFDRLATRTTADYVITVYRLK